MRRTASSTFSFPWPLLLLLCLVCDRPLSSAFLLPTTTTTTTPQNKKYQSIISRTQHLYYHPAVEGWEEKYLDAGGGGGNKQKTSAVSSPSGTGPRILSTEFEVRAATESELVDLDVNHWPIWTTADKEKWNVGNQVHDKEMPYGELSYVISGRLEIIPQSTNVPVIVSKGDFVTFPKGFVASWKVLEELTWNYYLY